MSQVWLCQCSGQSARAPSRGQEGRKARCKDPNSCVSYPLCLARGPWAPLVHSSVCLKFSSPPGPSLQCLSPFLCGGCPVLLSSVPDGFLENIRCHQLQLLRLCSWPAWTVFPKASQMRPPLAHRPTAKLHSPGLARKQREELEGAPGQPKALDCTVGCGCQQFHRMLPFLLGKGVFPIWGGGDFQEQLQRAQLLQSHLTEQAST